MWHLKHYTDGVRLRTLFLGINCLNATIDGVRLGTLLDDKDGARFGTLLDDKDGARLGTLLADKDGVRLGTLLENKMEHYLVTKML